MSHWDLSSLTNRSDGTMDVSSRLVKILTFKHYIFKYFFSQMRDKIQCSPVPGKENVFLLFFMLGYKICV